MEDAVTVIDMTPDVLRDLDLKFDKFPSSGHLEPYLPQKCRRRELIEIQVQIAKYIWGFRPLQVLRQGSAAQFALRNTFFFG